MSFSEETIGSINRIFRAAADDGRQMLYEHEVYQVLESIGLEVPKFAFVRNEREVTEELLVPLGPEVVCKIVSPRIAHKQKVGGVKRARIIDPLFIQFVCSRIKEEVLSHFPNEQTEIKGFLIVEYIPHRQALGYEVLIGAKNDPAFGPVITLTKGGDDAEFFAANYDPANLFLPPLEYDYALKMLHTLHIRQKFEQIGHAEYLQFMAKATAQISSLAECYSIMARPRPEFIIQAFEINPFVVTDDNRFVAIDGFAQFLRSCGADAAAREINRRSLESLFSPKGIAVIGASSDPTKRSLGREIGRLLHDLGRTDLFFINNKGGSISYGLTQYPFYRRLGDVPEQVDLAVYAAPAQFMMDFMEQLKGTRVKAAILISGIPANVEYSAFLKKLSEAMPEGIRALGPNCMGVFQAPSGSSAGLNTLFIEEKRLEVKSSPSSNAALLSQSGAFAVTAIDKLQNSRVFKSIVSFGNQYDIKITDLMAYFAKQKEMDVLALYIEGLDPGEGRQFYQLAKDMRKPVIVYKSGRTEAGVRAAASHTASMTGSYEVFQSACRQARIIQAENIGDHYDYVKVFSLLAGKIPSGNRVAGVVNAGFESTVGADELKNLRQAQFTPTTAARLNRINKYGLADTSSPFLDITPMADDGMYAEFVEALLQDEGVDCVFVAVVPHAVALKTLPENCKDADGLATRLVDLSRKYLKPMVVSVNAGRHYQEFVSIMEQNGLPVYTDIRSAIKSLDMFVSYHLELEQP